MLDKSKLKHGTYTAYLKHGCRCDECKLKMQQKSNKYYKSDREFFKNTGTFKTQKVQHGSYTSYKKYGCRCAKCREFIASKHREKVSGYDQKH